MKIFLPIALAALLITAVAAAQDTVTLKVGKYTVAGEGIEQIGDNVKIPGDKPATVTWTAGKDDVCKGACSIKMTGLQCVLSINKETNQAECYGKSIDEISISYSQQVSKEAKQEREQKPLDFSEGTQMGYNLVKDEFSVTDEEFMFFGKRLSSSPEGLTFEGEMKSPIKISGNKITGQSFYYGDIYVSSDEQAGITVYPGTVVASKDTILSYKGLFLQGKEDSYEFCTEPLACIGDTSYVSLDTKRNRFKAIGKSDGGPQITFTYDNEILKFRKPRGEKEIPRFQIENLEDTTMIITDRGEDKIPFMEIMTQSKKTVEDKPPVIFRNGRMVFMGFADDFWITNGPESIKSGKTGVEMSISEKELYLTDYQKELIESQDFTSPSFPMVFSANSDKGNLIGKDTRGDLNVLVTSFNEMGILPEGYSETEIDTKFMDLPPTKISDSVAYNFGQNADPRFLQKKLKEKFPHIKLEGVSTEQTKKLLGILERLPPALTSRQIVRKIELVPDDADPKKYGVSENFMDYYGWAEQKETYIRPGGMTESTIYHELMHLYLRDTERQSPESERLRKEYDKLEKQYETIKKTKGKSAPELPNLEEEMGRLLKQKDEIFIEQPMTKEWIAANHDAEMPGVSEPIRYNLEFDPSEYCDELVDKSTGGWKTGGDWDLPKHCFMRPYGCTTMDEDFATYVELAYLSPEKLASAVKSCPPPDCFGKKINILKKYGLIDSSQYRKIISLMDSALANCMMANSLRGE